MPDKSTLKQFKELEKTFKNTFSYQNTGPHDSSDIVLKFFLDTYTLRALADNAQDIVSRFKIDNDMKHYECQFGKMLGGHDGLEQLKLASENVAIMLLDARHRTSGQRILTNESQINYN